MTTEAFHPDHLKPGDKVGHWHIVESLGTGSFGHAFKAEHEGEFFTLKMAVRPAPELSEATPEKILEEGQVDGRMRHEGAVLLANSSDDGLPHFCAIGRWPHPKRGYLFIVTNYVPGEPFHDWRERTRPTVAQLVDIFIAVVRVVARLHSRGILIRDFKSEHVIVPEDQRPVLVDMGSAWLPGGSTLTVGLAPGTPYALPPECIAFLREGTWKQGARFNATEAGDLYQIGVFMYEALTEGWPFDARMTQDELLTVIQTVVPRAPHRLNPAVPESLSRIALRLLEKRPEDRYESAQVLLQALWEANKERSTPAWKQPLDLPPGGPAPMTQDEAEEQRLLQQETERRAQETRKRRAEELSMSQRLEQFSTAFQQMEDELRALDEKAARRKKRWRRIGLGVGLALLSLGLFAAGWEWLAPASTSPSSPEKGSSLVSTLRNSRPVRMVAAWLCTTFSVSCTAAQIRPVPADCPPEAVRAMDETFRTTVFRVNTLDQTGGKIISRVQNDKALPEGSLLFGQFWTEGITKLGQQGAYGRYTEALLPDGRRIPVCVEFAPTDQSGIFLMEDFLDGDIPVKTVAYWR